MASIEVKYNSCCSGSGANFASDTDILQLASWGLLDFWWIYFRLKQCMTFDHISVH